MKTTFLVVFVMIFVMAAAKTAELAKQEKQRQYTAPDGGVRVVVVPVSKRLDVPNMKAESISSPATARLLAPLIIPRKIRNTVSGL